MKVKANRVVAYEGKEYQPGEVFDMSDTHAKVNIFNGRVSTAEDAPAPRGGKPEAKRETLSAKKPKKGRHDDDDREKGRYKRRDVRAEDEDTHEGDD